MNLSIRRALPADLNILRDLACRVYTQNFEPNWEGDGLEEYLQLTFGEEVLALDLAGESIRYDLAFVDGVPAGFMKLKLEANLPGTTSERGMELNKLYILAAYKGLGIGQRLMTVATEVATALEKESIWLAVLKVNTPAIAFYTKWGFTRVGDARVPFPKYKEELRDMWRMIMRLP
jgi:ribosomal protein S18 acetylase RimI-like enzyme